MDPFNHAHFTPEVVKMINAAVTTANPDNWLGRRARGETLGWALDDFTISDKTEKRMYVTWFSAEGDNLNANFNAIPTVRVDAPVAPVKAAYLTMNAVLRYDTGDSKRALQKLVFDTDNTQYDDWAQFSIEINKLLNEDRAAFFIDNIENHTLLDANIRKVFAKKGREAAIEKILDAINNPNDNSQHVCGWNKAKSKVFKVRYDGDGMRVSPADEKILATEGFDPSGKIRDYLEAGDDSGKPYDLNLLRVTLADGVTVVGPGDLHRLHGDSMLAMHTLTIHGINKRPDGQHTVMVFNGGVQICTNGVPREATVGVDINAILMAHGAGNATGSPKKRVADVSAILRDAKLQKT